MQEVTKDRQSCDLKRRDDYGGVKGIVLETAKSAVSRRRFAAVPRIRLPTFHFHARSLKRHLAVLEGLVGARPGPQILILLSFPLLELEADRRGDPCGNGESGAEEDGPGVPVGLTHGDDGPGRHD